MPFFIVRQYYRTRQLWGAGNQELLMNALAAAAADEDETD